MRTFFAFASTVLCLLATSASAQPYALYWDPGMSTGASLGGSGIWDLNGVTPTWFDGGADVVWNSATNANNSDAWFEGTAGTVTIASGDAISAADLYFTNVTGGIYDITNSTGAETLTVANSIDTGGSEDIIGVTLDNSGTLYKNGNGILHLPFTDNLNNVVVNQGELSLENNGSITGGSITVANGATLAFNGGTNNLDNILTTVNLIGTGTTNNTGALNNASGINAFNGDINILGDTTIYINTNAALLYQGYSHGISDGGAGYNLYIAGTYGNIQFNGVGGNFGVAIKGSLIITNGGSCYIRHAVTANNFTNSIIRAGGYLEAEADLCCGPAPTSLMTNNILVDGGTFDGWGYANWTMNANRGITVTTNGGTIADGDSGSTWTSGNIYSPNTPVTFNCIGSMRPGGAAGGILGTINLGTGAFIKNGAGDCNLGYANPTNHEVYSNIVVNAGSLTFNYDSSGGQSSLGSVPSTLNPSNIWLNGGSLHVGHSTTIAATRGIYITSAGGNIQDVVSSGGTVTINSPISGPGTLTSAQGHSGVTSTLLYEAANTYGATIINSGAAVNVSGGSGTLGLGNTTDNGTLQFSRTGTYTYNYDISGSGVVNNTGSGTVILTGTNTYTGATTTSAGTLELNGTNAASAITVSSGGTLGGSGFTAGAVTVSSGGTLALGLGNFSVSNNLTISGNVTVPVNKSLTPSNNVVDVSGTLTGGSGTVTVTTSGPALALGDTFTLFNKPVSGGASMKITGGGPVGTTTSWINNLAVDGSITVQAFVPAKPTIKQTQIIGGNVVISGVNGTAGYTNIVLASTNLLLPIGQWTPISTNTFTGSAFSITNGINPANPQQFYLLQVPYTVYP